MTRELLAAIDRLPQVKLFRLAPFIDVNFIGGPGEKAKLSGTNRLAVAKALEQKCPAAIETMPNLGQDLDRLRRAAHLARLLSPDALKRLVDAIQFCRATGAKNG